MKKQLLTLVTVCAIAMGANAQTEKGDNLIGGSVGFNYNNQKPLNSGNTLVTGNSRSFNIAPRFGHFFGKNLAVGLQVGYAKNKTNSTSTLIQGNGSLQFSNSTTNSNSFNAIPYVRYYVDVADKFKFFGEGAVGVAFGKTKYNYAYSSYNINQTTSYKTTQYLASVNPGFAFFPTKKWAIEFSFPLISYNKFKQKDDGTNVNSEASSSESFTFAFSSFSPSIGFNFHF
ncbi:outer membrane beta-barrel protein [Pedobacter jeongneungensis]|uniref:outer membrane beta-barrel protein n=1 Tax=Pedobacter jeongneungensis TaxID=947309 RepID=UPI0013B434E1|nr:outer membrane beta-barrel protein [Pedobacter jeongneungensis]